MSETESAEQEQRDERVAAAISSGKSLRSVKREFGLTQAEVFDALERLWPIDARSRLQMIMADVGQITRLTEVFVERGLAGDTQSCLCAVRLWERKHELLGLNAAAKFEVVTAPRGEPSSYQRITDVLLSLKRDHRPNGDGAAVPSDDPNRSESAVGTLSNLDDPKPNP
jgi:hypothetical protein